MYGHCQAAIAQFHSLNAKLQVLARWEREIITGSFDPSFSHLMVANINAARTSLFQAVPHLAFFG
jgi:hypothetical protein